MIFKDNKPLQGQVILESHNIHEYLELRYISYQQIITIGMCVCMCVCVSLCLQFSCLEVRRQTPSRAEIKVIEDNGNASVCK